MLLEVQNLRTSFFLDNGELKAVDNISFTIGEQETVALVGESGCGKTVVALSIINLMSLPGRIIGGRILFEGQDLLEINRDKLIDIRGRDIGMIFQEPASSLDPVYTIGSQLAEVLKRHSRINSYDAKKKSISLLGDVGFTQPEMWASTYPHELSGGMIQRAAIAIAMCTNPKLLIADEPTTALDVTVQAEILDLLKYLRDKNNMSLLLISHDMGIIEEMSDQVMVMYTGKILEKGPLDSILNQASHPYTQGLLKSVNRLSDHKDEFIPGIPGTVPDLLNLPGGCSFHPRCYKKAKLCEALIPEMSSINEAHTCACHRLKD